MNDGNASGATALSLALTLATPAMAGDGYHGKHSRYHPGYVRDLDAPPKGLTIENVVRWGYGQGYGAPHTGFGGLYGDGNYPGNVYYQPEVNTRPHQREAPNPRLSDWTGIATDLTSAQSL